MTQEKTIMTTGDLETGFHQISLAVTGKAMAHWLTPFIEKAGFEWEIRPHEGGQETLVIAKILLNKHEQTPQDR